MYTTPKALVSVLMSVSLIAMSADWLSHATLTAQEDDRPKAADKEETREADARIDIVLRKWQKADKKISDRHFSFKRTEDHVTFGDKKSVSGEVLVHKPTLVRLDEKDSAGKLAFILLCNGKSIHWYEFGTKIERDWELSDSFGFPEKPEQYPSGFFNEIGGGALEQIAWVCREWPVKDLTDRFTVTLAKEDKYWIYVALKPLKRKRRLGFEEARVVLDANTYRVRQIWLRHGNGDEQTWDFGDADIDQNPVTVDSISKGLPKDWERVTVPVGEPKKDADKPK